MTINIKGRSQFFYLQFQQNVSMLLLVNFSDKIICQRSNPTDPVIIKTAFVVSPTAGMLVSPAFVVFSWPVLPQWQHKRSLLQLHPEVELPLHKHDLYCPSFGTSLDPVAKGHKNVSQVTHKTRMQNLIHKWLERELQLRLQFFLCPTHPYF